jgi:hypothetical protein
MSRVELVFDQSCPNVPAAREQIRAALSHLGMPTSWREWDRDAGDIPAALRPLGSPTILVDGRDVSGESRVDPSLPIANSCRVYADGDRLQGVPSLNLIISALKDGIP